MMAPIDFEGLRDETPGTAKIRHFNNAGSGLMSRKTLAAIAAQLDHDAEMGKMGTASSFHRQISTPVNRHVPWTSK